MAEMGIGELEATLGVSRRVVHRWVAHGLLPPLRQRLARAIVGRDGVLSRAEGAPAGGAVQ